MGSNCCLSLQNQERSWLAGFLTVLKHSLLLDTNETAHLENQVYVLYLDSSLTFTVM